VSATGPSASRIVIAGAGPGGLATARAYREAGADGEVLLVGAERHLPYRRPPLTKEFLRGEAERSELPIEAQAWFAEHRITLARGVRAVALDAEERRLTLSDGREVGYDACVLATGAEPARLPVPGAEDLGIATIRRVEDSERLREATGEGTRVVVVGSGFIGCEAAASLALRGAAVTQVTMEDAPQEARLGAEAEERIAQWLHALGVTLVTGAEIEAIEPTADGWRVRAPGRPPIAADVVAMGAGITPNASLAEAAGLAVQDGRVVVDAALRASADGVSAVGDVALAHNAAAGRRLVVEHWGEALNHGAVAGRALAGEDAAWDAVPGFWSTIGSHTLKHAAWGDGFDTARLVDHGDGAFTVYYGAEGVLVGVLAHQRDEDYERGSERVRSGAPVP
jgi:3-phenylpropionate/trans-cinnamate dioxygenase ferredoxin reductase component